MDSNSSSLRKWIWSFKFQHFLACLIDLAIWLVILLLIQRGLDHYFDFQKNSTATLIHLIGLALLVDRLMTIWPFRHIWALLKKKDPQSVGKVAEDLLQKQGYYPNQQLHQEAIENFGNQNNLPAYPWSLVSFREPIRSLIWIIGIFPIIAIDQYKPPLPESHQITIKVSPPDYLQQEEMTLPAGQKNLEVFPGTLLTVNIPKSLSIDKIKDQRGRLYLPRELEKSIQFDIRIMGNAQFNTMKEPLLKVTTLEDHFPKVEWIGAPEKLELSPLDCHFIASDDFGLKETLITVNDAELEYAGDPMGEQSFDYRWTFDPQEHLPLMGGNIKLQITAYDNDTIQGPKYTRSKALIWEFPGIEAITQESLTQLDELIEKNVDRLLNQNNPVNSDQLQSMMQKFAESMQSNPALSEDLLPIMDQILDDYENINQEPQPSEQDPHLNQGEKEQLVRNDDYYKFFKTALDNILQTIQKAQMVSDLKEAAEQTRQGNPPPIDFFNKMFDKLSDMASKGGLNPQEGQELMNQLNQADIASSLGEEETAAELMEDLAEKLRQSQSGPGQDNPLAQKFQQLMRDLAELIEKQNALISELSKTREKSSYALEQWRKAIQEQKQKTAQTDEFKTYNKTNQAFRNPNLSDAEKQKLLSDLGDPSTPTFQGRRQIEMMRTMDLFSARPDLKKKYQQQLQALNESLNEELKWPEELFEGPSGMPSPKEFNQVGDDQKAFSPRGEEFAEDFESSLGPVIPSQGLFRLADQAAEAAKQAGKEMPARSDRAQNFMQQAEQRWVTLQRLLQQMQQQGQGQGQSGQSQPRLSIGKDGRLQLQNENMLGQKEGDGPYRHKDEDLDIALPEDFQNTRTIEERLRQELLSSPPGEVRDQFQEYLLELLE
jgi:hypothetical protein